jgi:hypothetical protein
MADESKSPSLTYSDIVGICGDMVDWKVTAIIDTGASAAELEAAWAWSQGADEALGEERRPLAGVTAAVYDILIADEEFEEER